MMAPDELITAKELAAYWQVSRQRIAQLVRDGRLEQCVRRVGRRKLLMFTSYEGADRERDATAAPNQPREPRKPKPEKVAREPRAPRPVTVEGPRATNELDFDTMTKAEAVRITAIETARIKRNQRMASDIDLAVRRGEFQAVEDMADEIESFIALIVSGLEGMAGRFAIRNPDASLAMVDSVRILTDDIRSEVTGDEVTGDEGDE